MRLYIAVQRLGYFTVETASGKILFDGVIATDGVIASSKPLPDAVESGVRSAWVNRGLTSIDYTPATAPSVFPPERSTLQLLQSFRKR